MNPLTESQLHDLGIAVLTHDLDTRQESAAILGAVTGAMADHYRAEIGRRTRRGLEGLARQKKPTGGKAYGYCTEGGTRVIVLEQAGIIRRIFREYADGRSPKSIAAGLNADRVPSPGAGWNREQRRRSGWLASAIQPNRKTGAGILANDLYRGVIIWNRSRWIRSAADGKKRRRVINPRSEWIEHRDESLRIVPDALWNAAQARYASQTRILGARVRKSLKRAPGAGRPAQHLFTSVLECGECGAGFTLVNRTYYACASHHNGRACTSTIHVRRDLVEQVLLRDIKAALLDERMISEAVRRARKALARRKRPEVKIARLRGEVANLGEAIAQGLLRRSPTLAKRLAEAEAALAALEQQPTEVQIPPRLAERYRALAQNLESSLRRDPEKARAALTNLLGGRIRLTPDETRSHLIAESEIETPLIRSASGVSEIMVAGAGFAMYRRSRFASA